MEPYDNNGLADHYFINVISSEEGGNYGSLQIRVTIFSENYYHFLRKIMEWFPDCLTAGLNSE